MEVILASTESWHATVGGIHKRIASFNREDNHGFKQDETDPWATDIEACGGEMAFAKGINVFYVPGINTFKSPDVGQFGVRHTSLFDGCLVIRPKDPPGIYVLVTGTMPVYQLRGWWNTRDGLEESWLRAPNNRPPAHFIPQGVLHDISTLPKEPQVHHEPDDIGRGEGKAGFDKFRREHQGSVSEPIDF